MDRVELNEAGFEVGGRLGEGRYSVVRWARERRTGREVAVKIMDLSSLTEGIWDRFIRRELEALELAGRHASLVALERWWRVGSRVYAVLELASGGDLLALVQRLGAQTEAVSLRWSLQLLHGLTHLHSRLIAHRDVKLENILLTAAGDVKLADFTFARLLAGPDELSHTYCGSKAYSCPNILLSQPYNPFKADVFALGVVAFILLVGRMPFNENVASRALIVQQHHAARWRRFLTTPLADATIHAVHAMLAFHDAQRPTASQLITAAAFLPLRDAPFLLPTITQPTLTSPTSSHSVGFDDN